MYDILIRCPATLQEVPETAPPYVNSMESMFENCSEFDGDLSKWDMTNITSTQAMFKGARSFTGKGLSKWDTSNIKTMKEMFMNSNIKE